jgi:hypothetical protein
MTARGLEAHIYRRLANEFGWAGTESFTAFIPQPSTFGSPPRNGP